MGPCDEIQPFGFLPGERTRLLAAWRRYRTLHPDRAVPVRLFLQMALDSGLEQLEIALNAAEKGPQ